MADPFEMELIFKVFFNIPDSNFSLLFSDVNKFVDVIGLTTPIPTCALITVKNSTPPSNNNIFFIYKDSMAKF